MDALAPAGARDGPLFGRDVEIDTLIAALDADRAVAVLGEAGIGKTSLVRAAASASGRRLHEGGGFATLDWMPYLAIRRALGSGVGGDAPTVAAQVERQIGPEILFIDDVQWTDDDTRTVLELLVGRIMVILAIRTGDPGSAAADALVARTRSTTIALTGLSDEAAEAIVRRARPELAAPRAAAIVARAAGNPLLLEELALGGEASPVLERALASQLDVLSHAARTAVELVAVAERGIRRAVLDPAIDEAIRTGLVIERDGSVEIRHELVGRAVRAGLESEPLRAAHADVARLATEPVDRARHFAAAGMAREATTAALDALDDTTDPRDKAALLAVAAESAPATAGAAIRLRAGRALDELSEWSSVMRVLGPVGDGGSPEELAERDALLAHAAYAIGDLGAARQHLAAASSRAVDPASLAGIRRTVEMASFLVNVEGAVGPAVAELQAGIAVQPAGSAGDRDLSVLLTAIVLLATGQGDPGVVATGLDEAFDAGRYRTASDRARVLQFLLLMSSSAEATLAFLLAQTARFEAAGVGSVALEFQADAVLAAILAGRPDQAITLADELAELPAPVRPRQASGTYRARALTLRGAFDQAADQLTSLVATASPDFFGRGEVLIAQAELAYWSGRPTVAAKLAEAALEMPAPVPVAHVQPQLLRCWARSDLGLDPEITLASPLTPSQAGAPRELEALVAWHAGDAEAARAAFDQAADAWAGFFAPRRLVCQWAAGESVRRSGDREVASRRLMAVLEAANAMGFEPLAARVRRSLRLAGVRTSGVTRTQVLAAGGLTGRERELVALVEHGLTNVEIARRLGLGRPTVARILASAMTKLGVNSRAQLAAIAPD